MILYAPIANNEGPDAILSATLAIDGLAVSVVNTALMPAEGYVSIMRLGEVGEVVKVTGAAGNPYTIEREVDGTTAAEFTAGTELRHVETPTAVRVLINDGINVFTERNDFRAKLTNIERPAVPTDETIVQETTLFPSVDGTISASEQYLSLTLPDAPVDDIVGGRQYVFYNPDSGEFVEGYPIGVYVDKVVYAIERGAFNSVPSEWTDLTVVEVMQAGPLALPLTFVDKARKKIKTNGRVVELLLPDYLNDPVIGEEPTFYDGAELSGGDNYNEVTQGGIRVSDPNGGSVDMTKLGGRFESQFDYDADRDPDPLGNWTTLAATNEPDPGLGLQRLTMRVATVAALSSSSYSGGVITATSPALLTIDGVTVEPGDKVLVKNEATASRNGIYACEVSDAGLNFRLRRLSWFDEDAEILAGAAIFVSEGNVNGDTRWVLQTNAPFTVGTTDLTFVMRDGKLPRADFTSNVATGANTAETDLHSYTITGSQLGKTGDKLVATFSGIFANNANQKRLRVRYNNSVIFDTGLLTGNAAGTWVIDVLVQRVDTTSIRYVCRIHVGGVTTTVIAPTMAELNVSNHTASKVFKVTGQNGSSVASDIVARMSTIAFEAAA